MNPEDLDFDMNEDELQELLTAAINNIGRKPITVAQLTQQKNFEVWTTANGRRMPVSAMTEEHLTNARNHISKMLRDLDDETTNTAKGLIKDPTRLPDCISELGAIALRAAWFEKWFERLSKEMEQRSTRTSLRSMSRGNVLQGRTDFNVVPEPAKAPEPVEVDPEDPFVTE